MTESAALTLLISSYIRLIRPTTVAGSDFYGAEMISANLKDSNLSNAKVTDMSDKRANTKEDLDLWKKPKPT
jgi:hypothetical protein